MSDETKRLDVAAIEARANAATGGPWVSASDDSDPQDPSSMVVLRDSPGICVAPLLTFRDSLFIAHARTDVPDLVTEVRRLREIIDGRTTPPTDAECFAHQAAGGGWTVDFGDGLGPLSAKSHASARGWRGIDTPPIRWWAFDAEHRLCAWPVAS